MGLRDDRRGQAVQVGAILLLALFVVMLSFHQAFVVPQENKQVEFNDYQTATGDLADLRNAILRTAAQDTQTGVTVLTGSRYPARSLFVNPPPATGRLASSSPANVTISNVESTSDFQNVGTYLAAEGNTLNVSTRSVVFSPSYSELDMAPIVTAYGATYRAYDEPIFTTDQTLVEGNRITLVSIAGDLQAEGYTTPVTVEPVSAHTRTISVTGDDGPLNLTVPTELSATVWEDRLLANQMAPNGHVLAVTPGPRPDTVNVSLEGGQTYELRLGRVEVRERSNSAAERSPDARYLVNEVDRNLTAGRDGRIKLIVEARDDYNNPVSNANVTFEQPDGKGTFERLDGTNVSFPTKTNDDGRATVHYNATGFVGNLPVNAYLGTSEPTDDERKTHYTVTNTVTGSDDGEGVGSNINPGSFVVLSEATLVDHGGSDKRVNVTWKNQGDTSTNITAMRFVFYKEEQNNERIIWTDVHEPADSPFLGLPIHGNFKKLPVERTVAENETISFEFSFDSEDQNGNVIDYQPQPGADFFVIDVAYDHVYVGTYFVSFEQ